ncbi:MAG: cytochrome b/b6 domain-containing protein [Acidimicrobiaceae bacterium]|nr:cytochrome b/b6 domain-containing protein [Acidimicrobiaceae bacterium]
MGAPTPRRVEARARSDAPAERKGGQQIVRFDRVERTAHWLNASLFLILMLTGLALYFEPLMALVGRRRLVEDIHVYSGIALPFPVLVSALGYWGRGLRLDLSRLNRWIPDDGTWLRASLSERKRRQRIRSQLRLGKFNAGQKLNAAFTAGAIVVMLGTGLILRWYHPWPLSWRTGATLVHDWLSVAIVIVVLGHVRFALADPEALRSMITGRVSRAWARHSAPGWLDELGRPEAPGPTDEAGPLGEPRRLGVPGRG